mgnify:CR=1 FL=1
MLPVLTSQLLFQIPESKQWEAGEWGQPEDGGERQSGGPAAEPAVKSQGGQCTC